MSNIIYDKLVYGRELTPEQWSKLKYRPLDDIDMYGIAENPSFGIDKSLIGGGNYMEMFYYDEEYGNITMLCALFNIEAEHEQHQYPVEEEHPEQVYENTDEAQIPYLFVGPNYTGQDTPTATLSADDWNDLISGRALQFGCTKTGEEEPYPTIQDGSKTYDINYSIGYEYYEFHVDIDNTELINALNANGLRISGIGFILDNLSVTRPATFDIADFTKISLSKMAPSIYEEYFPTNYYLYIKEPFSIDNGETDYMIYFNIGKNYLESSNALGKFYTSIQTFSTPNVEVFSECVGMGTVSVSPQQSSYEALSEITMTAKANEGYMFSRWICADTELVKNPHTDKVGPTYYAFFGRPVTITVEAEPAEGGTVSGGGTYASGSNVILTATPNEGYIFDGWWEGETQQTGSEEAEWHIKVPSEDTTYTYTARFSSLEDRRLTYATNSDAGEIQWIAENCIDGTYSHNENGGEAILRNDINTLYGFADNERLTSINIPKSITSIENSAFYNCTNLTSVDLPNNLYSIKNGAFENCIKLTSIDLPSSLTSLEEKAFEGTGLVSIDLPSSLGEIESNAFGNCTKLANVYCYIETVDTISSIGAIAYGIFNNIAENPTLHVPSSVLSEYQKQEYTYYHVFGENIISITE